MFTNVILLKQRIIISHEAIESIDLRRCGITKEINGDSMVDAQKCAQFLGIVPNIWKEKHFIQLPLNGLSFDASFLPK